MWSIFVYRTTSVRNKGCNNSNTKQKKNEQKTLEKEIQFLENLDDSNSSPSTIEK